MSKWFSSTRSILDFMATIAVILASSVLIWYTVSRPPAAGPASPPKAPTVPIPKGLVPIEGTAQQGSRDARVGVIEFSEFQCPFCAKFTTSTLPELVKGYVDTGKVLWVFRHLPLESLHPFAAGAAALSVCAQRVGRFWAVHDAFFSPPAVGSADEFRRRALGTGLEAADLASCEGAGLAAQQVQDDLRLAKSLQVKSTPTFLVGSTEKGGLHVLSVVLGARPIGDFRAALDAALSEAEVGRVHLP